MKVAVRYFSRTGNTKKLAESIGHTVGAKALEVFEPLDEKADILFLGSSVYAGGYDRSIGDFLTKNAEKIGLLALFGSSASGSSNYKKIKDAAQKCGIKLCNKEFVCNGKFLFLHKNRPNEDDLSMAAAFAGRIVSEADNSAEP